MVTLAQRVLGLTRLEFARAWPLFAYLFLTIAGSVASRAARDALFLDRFAATDLPYVDIAIAAIVALVAGVYIRAGERTNLRNLQIATLLSFAAAALAFWWIAQPGAARGSVRAGSVGAPDVIFVVIYVWVGVVSVLIPAQVWTLANYVMTTREAKRAFGFIGSGAILGWIVGGLVTQLTASRFGTETMLLWIAATLALSAGLVWHVWKRRPDYVEDVVAAGSQFGLGDLRGGMFGSLALIRDSRYLTAIALLIWLSSVVTTIAGWQFKAIAKANIPDTDALAAFFGAFNMAAGAVSFVLQIAVTGRLLKSAGIGVALFIVPIVMSISSAALLVAGSLFAVAAVRAGDQMLRYTIDKVTVELLYLPVPAGVTFRVKSFIDTVVTRLGDAGGGVLILLFGAILGWSPVQLSWIVLVLVIGWLRIAWIARRQYVENLRESIYQHRVDVERATAAVLDRSASNLVAARLSGTPSQVLYALSVFEVAQDRSVHPAVRALLGHASGDVRQHAIRMLARAGDVSVMRDVERLLYDEQLEVRTEALLYLTQHAHIDPLERIEQLGAFEDFSIRAAMAAFLARPGRAQNLDAARAILGRMVSEPGAEGRRTRLEAARLIGVLPDEFERELRILLADEFGDVAAAAARSASRLRKRSVAPAVLARLGDEGVVSEAAACLASFGDSVVSELRDALKDRSTPVAIRREIPAVLQSIGTPAAQDALLDGVLASDTILRHRIITALNKLAQLHPDRRVDRRIVETVLGGEIMGHYRSYQVLRALGVPSVAYAPATAMLDDDASAFPVVQGLRDSVQQEAERIFRLLKILYPTRDLHSAYVGLQSVDPVVHDNALEFLETILAPQIWTLLAPLFDRGVSVEQRASMADRLFGGASDREETIGAMIESRDPWLQSCAAYAIGEFNLRRFAPVLDAWVDSADPLVRATAADALEKLGLVAAH